MMASLPTGPVSSSSSLSTKSLSVRVPDPSSYFAANITPYSNTNTQINTSSSLPLTSHRINGVDVSPRTAELIAEVNDDLAELAHAIAIRPLRDALARALRAHSCEQELLFIEAVDEWKQLQAGGANRTKILDGASSVVLRYLSPKSGNPIKNSSLYYTAVDARLARGYTRSSLFDAPFRSALATIEFGVWRSFQESAEYAKLFREHCAPLGYHHNDHSRIARVTPPPPSTWRRALGSPTTRSHTLPSSPLQLTASSPYASLLQQQQQQLHHPLPTSSPSSAIALASQAHMLLPTPSLADARMVDQISEVSSVTVTEANATNSTNPAAAAAAAAGGGGSSCNSISARRPSLRALPPIKHRDSRLHPANNGGGGDGGRGSSGDNEENVATQPNQSFQCLADSTQFVLLPSSSCQATTSVWPLHEVLLYSDYRAWLAAFVKRTEEGEGLFGYLLSVIEYRRLGERGQKEAAVTLRMSAQSIFDRYLAINCPFPIKLDASISHRISSLVSSSTTSGSSSLLLPLDLFDISARVVFDRFDRDLYGKFVASHEYKDMINGRLTSLVRSETKHGTLNLEEVLLNSTSLQAFRSFLVKEQSEENLNFINDVAKFRSATSMVESEAQAKLIWNQYLNATCPTPVNIGSSTMRAITMAQQNGMFGLDIFDAAAREVQSMLHNDSFARFTKTSEYQRIVATLKSSSLTSDGDTSATAASSAVHEANGMKGEGCNASTATNHSLISQLLTNTHPFMKHGRNGKPHAANIKVSRNGNVLVVDWGSSGSMTVTSSDGSVVSGKRTKPLMRDTAALVSHSLCCSVISSQRSLDLQAATQLQCQTFVKAMTAAIASLPTI